MRTGRLPAADGPGPVAREASADRLVLLANSPRLPPGLLSWPAWQVLRAGQVFVRDPGHVQLPFLRDAGVRVHVLEPEPEPGPPVVSAVPQAFEARLARAFRARATGRTAVWLAGPDGDPRFVRALGDLVAREPDGRAQIEVVYGSYDPAGARLLDVVTTMDRLRSPGGCPWDAEQTHRSLAGYLLEEAYEAYQALEDGDLSALRDELGDVLLQVAFHSRLAEELPAAERWSIDDVAAGLVDKLVRRHPHVFAGRSVSGVEEVVSNWQAIKAAEKPRTSVTDGVPLSQPALALAARLQSRAAGIGLPADLQAGSLSAGERLPRPVAGSDPGGTTMPPPADAAAAPGRMVMALAAAVAGRPAGGGNSDRAGDGNSDRDGDGNSDRDGEADGDVDGDPDGDRDGEVDSEVDSEVARDIGRLLFAAVALARAHGVDAEAALRLAARGFRDRLATVEAAQPVAGLTEAQWRQRWLGSPPEPGEAIR